MKTLPMILLASTISISGAAWAAVDLPTGASVAAGTASISQVGNTMTVTNSNRAIINWNSFSVGAGGTVQFVQPSASSSVLNRVIGITPSQLNGPITSNGQVFLLNPNGIIVGPGGSIQASGIYLSTASITDGDFLAGNLQFQPPPAGTPIVISGSLTATDLIDIRASSLDASGGTINAPSINFDNGAGPPPPLVPGGDVVAIGGGSTGGSLALAAGTIRILQQTGGSISMRGGGGISVGPLAPNTPPIATTAASPGRGAIRLNTSGLVDGAVTVRMSLVDASPITLR